MRRLVLAVLAAAMLPSVASAQDTAHDWAGQIADCEMYRYDTGGCPFAGSALTFSIFDKTDDDHDIGADACYAINAAGGYTTASYGKGSTTPTVHTRSTGAYAKIWDGTSYLLQWVTAETLRCERWIDANSDTFTGYLPEAQATNLAKQSQTLGTTWSALRAGVVEDVAVAPDGTTTADGITDTAADSTHLVYQSMVITAASHVFSLFAKASAGDYVTLRASTTSEYAIFDLSTCAVTVESAGATGYVVDHGGGWCRVAIASTATAASNTYCIYPSNGAAGYEGDGSTQVYVWGAQVELGSYPSSYTPTTSAAVTRTGDQLAYVAGANIGGEDRGKGTIVATVVCPATSSATLLFWSLSDGGSTSENMQTGLLPTGRLYYLVRSTEGGVDSNTTTTDVTLMSPVDVRVTWDNPSTTVNAYVGSVLAGSDTDAQAPDGADFFRVGSDVSGNNQPGCLITSLKIYKKAKAP